MLGWSESVSEYVWVAGGAVLTLVLGVALLYWGIREGRALGQAPICGDGVNPPASKIKPPDFPPPVA